MSRDQQDVAGEPRWVPGCEGLECSDSRQGRPAIDRVTRTPLTLRIIEQFPQALGQLGRETIAPGCIDQSDIDHVEHDASIRPAA